MNVLRPIYFLFILLLLGCGHFNPTIAATPLVLGDGQAKYSVGRYLEFLEDPHKTLTFKQVSSPEFQSKFFSSPNNDPNFGNTESVYWAHLRIKNLSKNDETWQLELKAALLRYVDFYFKLEGEEQFREINTGTMRPFESRQSSYRRFVFSLPIPSGETADLYLRVENDWVLFPLTVWDTESFIEKKSNENLIYGLIYGAILTIVLLNFLLWIYLKDYSFFYLACFLLSVSMFKSSVEGLGLAYLWRNQFSVINILYSLSFILTFFFALRFETSFLLSKQHSHRFHVVCNVLQGFWLVLLGVLLAGYIYLVEIIHLTALITIFVMLIGAVYIRYKGFKPANYYLLGWIVLFFVAAQALMTLWLTGADYEDVELILNIGVLLPMFFFSLALLNRVITFRKQREAEQAEALRTAKEHESSMRKKNIQLKLVNEEALQAKEAAEVANLAKSNFLTSISHELRTPLHQIINISELIKVELESKLDEEQKELIDYSGEAAHHLSDMIDDILEISDIDQGLKEINPSEVRLKPLLETVTTNHSSKNLKSDLTVRVNIPPELEQSVIHTDERIMKQILFNLFSNAVKFSKEGGNIEVKVLKNAQTLKISVCDDGIGIDPTDLDKIFDPFFQVKGGTTGKTPGVGLGLTHSKKLVGLLNGSITPKSEGLGKGSCFILSLPLDHSKATP